MVLYDVIFQYPHVRICFFQRRARVRFQPRHNKSRLLCHKPLADKTIERIKEQLSLQCILEINGQSVAYINIQGKELRKCCVGDNIKDLFKVLNINQQSKSVDISIIDHKVTLQL